MNEQQKRTEQEQQQPKIAEPKDAELKEKELDQVVGGAHVKVIDGTRIR